MRSLEERIRPPFLARPLRRDVPMLALLAALALVLIPAWNAAGGRYVSDVLGTVGSFYMLAAMAFLVALRCGAVDLSVWMVAAVGGLVAAAMLQAGTNPIIAVALAGASGLAFGAVNGALTAGLRIPAPLATGVTAVVALLGTRWVLGGDSGLATADDTFVGWLVSGEMNVVLLRATVVALIYAAAMMVLVAGVELESLGRASLRVHPRRLMLASMCASGLLAGLAGACWLIDRSVAPAPTRPIGDLRIPVAAVLAGAVYFGGRGRALLAGLCLPPAMLLATIWRQEVWFLSFHGYELQLLLLAGMVGVAQVAMARSARGGEGRSWATVAAACTSAGLVIVAASAWARSRPPRDVLHIAGLVVWIAGAALLMVSRSADMHQRAKAG